MLYPFFELAARSLSRQKTFRQLLAMHLIVVAGTLIVCGLSPERKLTIFLGQALLLSGIVEGALLLGWRLTQLPKSNAMEPLLLTPVPPPVVLLGEELVGLTYLGFFTLATAPVLVVMVSMGWLTWEAAAFVLLHGFLWGAVTGLGLTCWAYEPLSVRRWGTRISGAVLLAYLIIGGLLGEQTFALLSTLPGGAGSWIRDLFFFFHWNNPFSIVVFLGQENTPGLLTRLLWVEGCGIAAVTFFVVRAAARLKGHYIDHHFRPLADLTDANRGHITDRPLTWWAVRRVTEYAGQINLYLAFGAAIAYSCYLVLANNWPAWLGRHVFIILEMLGGVPALCTVLFLLAAVPFAYQYGLWDSSVPERCRRLELLLLTGLDAHDYALASLAASWRRGRGYVLAAAVLLFAGWWSGRYSLPNTLVCFLVGLVLIGVYFAVSFRVFASNRGGTTLGFVLSIVLPLLTWGLGSIGMRFFTSLLPPGAIFHSLTAGSLEAWLPIAVSSLCSVILTVWLTRSALATFDKELRTWYDRNSGKHA